MRECTRGPAQWVAKHILPKVNFYHHPCKVGWVGSQLRWGSGGNPNHFFCPPDSLLPHLGHQTQYAASRTGSSLPKSVPYCAPPPSPDQQWSSLAYFPEHLSSCALCCSRGSSCNQPNLFIQQICIECLLSAKYCSRCWTVSKRDLQGWHSGRGVATKQIHKVYTMSGSNKCLEENAEG